MQSMEAKTKLQLDRDKACLVSYSVLQTLDDACLRETQQSPGVERRIWRTTVLAASTTAILVPGKKKIRAAHIAKNGRRSAGTERKGCKLEHWCRRQRCCFGVGQPKFGAVQHQA